MSQVQLIPQYASKTSGSNTWTLTGELSSTGRAELSTNDGTSGEKVLFLFGLPASLPLDTDVSGIEVTFVGKAASGSFSSETLKVNLGLYVGDTDQPFSMGTEKTLSLSGHSSGTLTFGSSSDEWGKAFWTRKELLYGDPVPVFGLSVRRTGSKGIEISNPRLNVTYTQSSNLSGSRAAPPFSQVPLVIPEKFDGSGEENTVKSDDVNLLGDALYNIEKASIDTSDVNDDIKAIGSTAGVDMVTATVFVSGTISNIHNSVFYEEINNGTTVVVNSAGVQSSSSIVPSLPPGRQVNFESLAGTAYLITSSGAVFPTFFTPGSLAIRRDTDGKHKHRLSFRLDSASVEHATDPLSKGKYQGAFTALGNPTLGLSNLQIFNVPLNSPNGSSNILGMGATYTSLAGPSTADPQPFTIQAYSDPTTYERTCNLQFNSKLGSALTKGYKWIERQTVYDSVEFDIASLATYDYDIDNSAGVNYARRLFRGGFLLKSSGSFGALSGYGLMISTGRLQSSSTFTGPAAVAWIVKLSGLDLSKRYDWGASFSSATYYQTFPWPGASSAITNLGSTYADLSTDPGIYKFSAIASGSVTVVKFDSINETTGVATELLKYVDSSPLTGQKAGFFQVSPTSTGTSESSIWNAAVSLSHISFGFASRQSNENIKFEARLQGLGRLTDVII